MQDSHVWTELEQVKQGATHKAHPNPLIPYPELHTHLLDMRLYYASKQVRQVVTVVTHEVQGRLQASQ